MNWDRLEIGDCWTYTGKSRRGRGYNYGGIKHEGKTYAAHRLVWTLLVGPIPDGLVMDHLCKNTPCCNPDHLEPVTQAENIRRGATGKHQTRPNLDKTHCPHGHPYSGDNRRFNPSGSRRCRTCSNAEARARYHRDKEKTQ